LFAGVVSGFLVAASFMPVLSVYHNWRQWHPGTEEVTVLGSVPNFVGSRVISVSDWDELRETGMPSSRLWKYDSNAALQQKYALIAHGVWRRTRFNLGDKITLDLSTGPVSVPVAGIWQPFHPQLGDNWVVLVGNTEIPVATGRATEVFAQPQKPALLPPAFRGRSLLSWLLFNSLVFILYGILGLLGRLGHFSTIGWAAKLWAGGVVAVFSGLVTAVLVFMVFMPLPVLGLLPMTLGLLAASYLLAMLLLTGLCLVLTRWT
jgi:hypothetical protein